ncbi:MAG TPA: 2-C-methyl-D-erythritol 4-phosphate cytidylyltransferase, partial [Myxococcaceae bacterium]|nr:2-C-methyl-D-erythritol 4-phosphate cytidylyltransferase [Myxococcaceae bacterium]
MSVVGILPAAGSGRRFGAAKQFRELRGLPLLVHAALGFERAPSIQSFVVAVPAGDEERVRALLLASGLQKLHRVVAGGAERAESVRRALEAAPPGARYAVIHDAARPFASPALF